MQRSIKATTTKQCSFSSRSRLDGRIEKLKPLGLSINVDLTKVPSYLYITDRSFYMLLSLIV